MPPKSELRASSELGVALNILRIIRGMTQDELAEASGLRSASISNYERGVNIPELASLRRLLAALGYPLGAIDLTEDFVRRMRSGALEGAEDSPRDAVADEVAAVSLEIGRVATRLTRTFLQLLASSGEGDDLHEQEEDLPIPAHPMENAAEELWGRLKGLPPKAQAALAKDDPAFQVPALCLFLCRESIRLAGESPRKALAAADAAVLISRGIPDRADLIGYSLVHLGNAHRVQGDLPAAERILSEGETLLQKSPTEEPLDDAVIFALKASLRRTQGRLEEALALHEQALARPGASLMRAELLASKAYTLDEAGDVQGVLSTLEEAAQNLSGKEDPRLLLSIRHNLVDALSKAGRFEEGKELLGEAKRLAFQVGTDLDVGRMQWTEGRIEAGLGDLDLGTSLLLRARGIMVAKGIALDTALVSLELALLYLQQDRKDSVKDIARHLAPLFRAQALPRETLAALALFRRAAETGDITPELPTHLLEYLRQTRHRPGFVFSEDGHDREVGVDQGNREQP
jgi:transcriptional regulator with XRE-family HTH domain